MSTNDFYGSDMALEQEPKQASNEHSSSGLSKSEYINRLEISIRSLYAMHKKDKRKRAIKTIVVLSIISLLLSLPYDQFFTSDQILTTFISCLFYSAIIFFASNLLLSYYAHQNNKDIIRIEKLKTELAILKTQPETTYDLPTFHSVIKSNNFGKF